MKHDLYMKKANEWLQNACGTQQPLENLAKEYQIMETRLLKGEDATEPTGSSAFDYLLISSEESYLERLNNLADRMAIQDTYENLPSSTGIQYHETLGKHEPPTQPPPGVPKEEALRALARNVLSEIANKRYIFGDDAHRRDV
ncbi:MAG: hypothetical protein JJU29_01670 [Verrucomicrobia bacterium]|nr:hypothetical protein [Verrucomicrobiota bacterium]MCH8510941.1 hypothetical protein [Kiritimatiellia bacterium]